VKESGLWAYLKNGMGSRWFPTRIESSSGNGVPDVVFAMVGEFGSVGKFGWIELKYTKEWPKRQSTLVRLQLRPEQKLWISTSGVLTESVWVLHRVADDFFLLDWQDSIQAVEGWTRDEWSIRSRGFWNRKIDFQEFTLILKGVYK
jgi:hypothetical protein